MFYNSIGNPYVPGDFAFLNVCVTFTHSSFNIIPTQYSFSSSLNQGISLSVSVGRKVYTKLLF